MSGQTASFLDQIAKRLNNIIILECAHLLNPQGTHEIVGRVIEVGTDYVRLGEIKYLESRQITIHISEIVGFQ